MYTKLEKAVPHIHKCFALRSLRLAYRKPRAFEPLLSLEYVHGNNESCMIKTPTLCREGNKSRVGNGEKILTHYHVKSIMSIDLQLEYNKILCV